MALDPITGNWDYRDGSAFGGATGGQPSWTYTAGSPAAQAAQRREAETKRVAEQKQQETRQQEAAQAFRAAQNAENHRTAAYSNSSHDVYPSTHPSPYSPLSYQAAPTRTYPSHKYPASRRNRSFNWPYFLRFDWWQSNSFTELLADSGEMVANNRLVKMVSAVVAAPLIMFRLEDPRVLEFSTAIKHSVWPYVLTILVGCALTALVVPYFAGKLFVGAVRVAAFLVPFALNAGIAILIGWVILKVVVHFST